MNQDTENQDIVEIIRVIRYTGPRDKIEAQLERSLQNGVKRVSEHLTIEVETLGIAPRILNRTECEAWFLASELNKANCRIKELENLNDAEPSPETSQ